MPETQIIINNSNSKLVNLEDKKILKSLEEFLSYETTTGFWNGKFTFQTVTLFDLKTGIFPTGLFPSIENFLKQNYGIIIQRLDRRDPGDHSISLPRKFEPKLRPYQKAIVESCIEHGRGIVESATGTGKSIMLAELIHRIKMPSLVVVPTVNIMEQMARMMEKIYGKSKVGRIVGGGAKRALNLKKIPIWVASVQSLPKIPQEFFDQIGLLLIDEFHHAAATTYQDLNLNAFRNIYYRFGFTGTNFRNDGADLALQGVLSNVIYKYDAPQAIQDGYLCKVRFIVYDYKHEFNDHKDYRKEYNASIIENEDYHQTVANLTNSIQNKKPIPTLILVREIKHGEALKPLIPGSMLITGKEPSATAQKMLKDFEDGKYSVLIGTSCIGEGVDLPSAQIGIMAGGGKAKSEIIQKIGRFLRPCEGKSGATIIDFTHEGSPRLWRHAKARMSIYSNYGEGLIARRHLPIFN